MSREYLISKYPNASRDAGCSLAKEASEDLNAVDEALTKLAAEDPANAELVKLRFFAGRIMPEIARMPNISLVTPGLRCTYARTWRCAEFRDRGHSEKS